MSLAPTKLTPIPYACHSVTGSYFFLLLPTPPIWAASSSACCSFTPACLPTCLSCLFPESGSTRGRKTFSPPSPCFGWSKKVCSFEVQPLFSPWWHQCGCCSLLVLSSPSHRIVDGMWVVEQWGRWKIYWTVGIGFLVSYHAFCLDWFLNLGNF